MEEGKNTLDKINFWLKNSVGVKIFTIGFLILLLLIPMAQVDDLIRERKGNQYEAVREVSQKWGEHQTITGIVLSVPYTIYSLGENSMGEKVRVPTLQTAHFLPNSLDINGAIDPEIRYRGIYEVIVYSGQVTIKGSMGQPDFKVLNINENDVHWDQAYITLGISDLRSIQDEITLNWNDQAYSFDPGVMDHDVVSSGVSAKINLDPDAESHKYALQLNFNGSEGMDFSPLGKVTTVEVQSNWPDPSFDGAFLPDSRQISDSGFTASWKVLHLNRSIPQQFTGKQRDIDEANFGVKLMLPVDQYQKSTRAVKYAILLISLTFLVFFFSQIKRQLRVHPIQYLMIGLAICLFFVLLVAISEHWNFDGAYVLGAIAMIGVITGYSHLSFKNTVLTRVLLVTLSTIYTFIYVIIQLQDHALLLGSIGLFIILAVVMFMSRNVDWYNVGRKE